MDNTKIFNLFSYIAELEEFANIDIFNDEWHIEKVPELRTKFKLIDNNLREKKFKNFYAKKETIENWFELLPCVIQREIFKLLPYKCLINFCEAYPSFKEHCLKPSYWHTLKTPLKIQYFRIEEMKLIINQLNKYLKSVRLDLSDFQERCDIFLEEILKEASELKIIDICIKEHSNAVNILCNNSVNLTYLRIDWDLLNSNHLKLIADSLKYLNSLLICSKQNCDEGLKYMIEKIKFIKSFGFRLESLDDEILKYLLTQHAQTLRKLNLSYTKVSPSTKVFSWLKECVHLAELSLRNVYTDIELYHVLDNFNDLRFLRFLYDNFNETSYANVLFKKPKLKLKRLFLVRIGITESSYEDIPNLCPNVDSLYIYDCTLKENEMQYLLQRFLNLKYLKIIKTTIHDTLELQYLNNKEIVQNLRSLNIVLLSDIDLKIKDWIMNFIATNKGKDDKNYINIKYYS